MSILGLSILLGGKQNSRPPIMTGGLTAEMCCGQEREDPPGDTQEAFLEEVPDILESDIK